jgi:HD-GYP domain-containing protein (c-di-GMP phosphodiesterase class II)
VLAVADVFVAITEDRPYRNGMPEHEARTVLADMAARRQLDPDIVRALFDDFGAINTIRAEAQAKARAAFQRFRENLSGCTKDDSV